MPTYQYACTECGHGFDVVQSFSEDSLTVCPECGGRLRKVFNAVGVVFKGSGFYRTDSRGKQTTSEAGSSASATSETSAAKADSSSGSTTKSESSTSTSSGTSGSSGSSSTGAASTKKSESTKS